VISFPLWFHRHKRTQCGDKSKIKFLNSLLFQFSSLPAKEYTDSLHKGSRPSTHQHARELRKSETEAEQKLWFLLRNRQLKQKKFRRQHAVASYVLDFYCHECKLAIELDGEHHAAAETKDYDSGRTLLLNEHGITVLRFWNEEVLNETEKVMEKVVRYLAKK
jgi:very-short-patch-repair endonuclease